MKMIISCVDESGAGLFATFSFVLRAFIYFIFCDAKWCIVWRECVFDLFSEVGQMLG